MTMAPDEPSEDAGLTPDDGDEVHVLIVDDDEETREYLTFKLGQQYSVAAVADGEECLEYLDDFDTPFPDVMTLDLMMPKVDGYEILEAIASHDWYADVSPIVVTGMNQEENLTRAFQLGAADFVRKPISIEELRIRIERLLQ